MKTVVLCGKVKGVYENNPFYQLFFLESVAQKCGEGSKPYVVQKRGTNTFTHAVGCTKEVFDTVVIGEAYTVDQFLFNAKGKLAEFS